MFFIIWTKIEYLLLILFFYFQLHRYIINNSNLMTYSIYKFGIMSLKQIEMQEYLYVACNVIRGT